MEDFIGIIIFILFMVLRTKKDRDRGMRKGKKRTPQEILVEKRQTVKKAVKQAIAPKTPTEKMKGIPAQPAQIISEFPAPNYEETNRTEQITVEPMLEAVNDDKNVALQEKTISSFDLRQAVIWSEVLDKPRFKGKYSR